MWLCFITPCFECLSIDFWAIFGQKVSFFDTSIKMCFFLYTFFVGVLTGVEGGVLEFAAE